MSFALDSAVRELGCIPGLPRINLDDIEAMVEHNNSHRKLDEEAERSQGWIAISNSNGAGGQDNNNGGQQDASEPRTKTASFRQNGYSEEIFKISQHLRKDVDEKLHTQESTEIQAPPGFEKENTTQKVDEIISQVQGKSGCKQGKEKDLVRNSQTSSTEPPGFVTDQANHYSPVQLKPTPKTARKVKKTTVKPKTARNDKKEVNLSPANSNETTESMLKIAEESIQLGELLGVRVIENKKIAVARITEHLKKRKGQGRTSQNQQRN